MKIDRFTKIVFYVLLTVTAISFLYPMVWMLLLSFKEKSEAFNNPFLPPKVWDFANYREVILAYNFFTLYVNSIIYTLATMVLTLLIAPMFAYASSRMNWKFSNTAMTYISLGLMIPVPVVIIPIFIILKSMGMMGTYSALVLPYTAFALAGVTLFMYAFLRTIPKEMEESAYMDGCSIYGGFFKIILPIIKPALATQAIFLFMSTWNEFYMAFILVSKPLMQPITVGIMNYFAAIGTTDWGQVGAAMTIASLPAIIMYLIFNEQIEHALTAGAILK